MNTSDPAVTHQPLRGHAVELVRWRLSRDNGWSHELMSGFWVDQSEFYYRVLTRNEQLLAFPRKQWMVCSR